MTSFAHAWDPAHLPPPSLPGRDPEVDREINCRGQVPAGINKRQCAVRIRSTPTVIMHNIMIIYIMYNMSFISFKISFKCVSWRDRLAASGKKWLDAETIATRREAPWCCAENRRWCKRHRGLTWGWMGGWLSLARRFRVRCKPGVSWRLLLFVVGSGEEVKRKWLYHH